MGQILLPEGAAPSTPASAYVAAYPKTDGLLYSKDDAGNEYILSGAANTGGTTIASATTIDIFGSAGSVITVSGTTTVTGITACASAQVWSSKTIIPSNAAGFSITASANIEVDGATSGTYLMPQNANIQIIATSTTTFKITTVYAYGTWSPVVTSQTGTITTVGTVSGCYAKHGRLWHFEYDVVITTNGTGATAIIVSGLPFSFANNIPANGQEIANTAKSTSGITSGATIGGIRFYDGTYPGSDGAHLVGALDAIA